MGPFVTVRGYTARLLASMARKLDTGESDTLRATEYQELAMYLGMPGAQALAHDDVVRVATMQPSATALQLGISAAFSKTAVAMAFQNGESPSNPNGKQCLPLFWRGTVSGAPTSATNWRYATAIDTLSRLPTTISGTGQPGTPATATAYLPPVVGSNSGTKGAAVGQPYFPLSIAAGAPITVPTDSAGSTRYFEGNGMIRGQIPVAGDEYWLHFGLLDAPMSMALTAAAAGASRIVVPHEPVEIAPQHWFLLHQWGASNATAGIIFDGFKFAWIER